MFCTLSVVLILVFSILINFFWYHSMIVLCSQALESFFVASFLGECRQFADNLGIVQQDFYPHGFKFSDEVNGEFLNSIGSRAGSGLDFKARRGANFQ